MELATVGVNYGLKIIEIALVTMHTKAWTLTGFSDLSEFKILFPIRKDPPFFKTL
jgi:hypothetical protein